MLTSPAQRRRGLWNLAVFGVVALAAFAAIPAVAAIRGDETLPPAPADPFDARHVSLDLKVTADTAVAQDVGVGVGVASGHPSDEHAIVLRLLDSRGSMLAEVGLGDPLERHIYPLPNELVDPEQSPSFAHETDYLKVTTTTVTLPLLPHLAGIEINRLDSTGRTTYQETIEVVDQLSRACGQDGHPDCRQWLDSRS